MSRSHVCPLNDIQPHAIEPDSVCDCDPRMEILESGDILLIHNSFDGREIIEQLENPS